MTGNDNHKLNKSNSNRCVGNNVVISAIVKSVPRENGQGNDVEVRDCFHSLNDFILVQPDIEH